MLHEHRDAVRERRRIENIRMAIRAREFTAEETLEMGIAMIEFALEFGRGMEDGLNDENTENRE